MAKILSIEQKAELFDKILSTMKTYYANLDDTLEKAKPKRKPPTKKEPPKEKAQANIHFNTFWDKYPKQWGNVPWTAKERYALTDEERTQAIAGIEPYKKRVYGVNDWLKYMVIPMKYLTGKYRLNDMSTAGIWIDYTNLEVFHRYMRQWKEDILRANLWDKYNEVKTKYKLSDFYLEP